MGGKRDVKVSSSDEPNKRIMNRFKAAQLNAKATTGDKSQAGKENPKRNGKRSRKRRKPQDESRSTSHDKNSTILPGKQIRITKDKHFINPNLSKLIRRSINDCSQGHEKTVKIGSRNKDKQTIEEKKKQLDTFNETIRKNNLRSMQNSKEIRGDSLAGSHVNLSSNAAGSPVNPMSNYAKKLNKIMKCKKDSDDNQLPREIGQTSQIEKSSPNKQSLLNINKEDLKKKKAPQSTREQLGQQPAVSTPSEGADLKKGLPITFKKIGSSDTPKPSGFLVPPVQVDSRERTKEKSGDERKSSEELKKKGKAKNKKDSKKDKKPTASEAEKIKENLLKLNQRAKHVLRYQTRGISKRLTKQRRSKSSNDLLSDQLLKKMLGRSDSVNIKHGQNEDQMYQEFKNLIGKDKKGPSQRDTALRDKILKKSYKEKAQLPKQVSSRPIKLKQSKSTKVYKRLESYPMRVKKLAGLTSTVPTNQLMSVLKDTHSSDKSKEREILDRINQLSSKIQRNYENIPSFVAKLKQPTSVSQGLYMPTATGTRKSKKTRAKCSKKKVSADQDGGSEDIPAEERELIDKEILMPKSSSDYTNGVYGTTKEKDKDRLDNQSNLKQSERKKFEERENNSPKSMQIRDSESSDREKSQRSVNERDEDNEIDYQSDKSIKDQGDETPRYTQPDPFSKENFDKWIYLLQEFKKCQKNGNVDGELKDLLISFCDKTQKGINQLIEEVHLGKKGLSYSEQKAPQQAMDSPTEDESKRRRKPHLGIDVEKINEDFAKKSDSIQVKDTRSNSFQWLKAEFEQNLNELSKLLGNNKDVTIKKIQVRFSD